MWWWSAFYGLLTLATLALAFHKGVEGGPDAAVVLGTLFLVSNISYAFVRAPYNQFYPFADGFAVVLLAYGWRHEFAPWKIALVSLLMMDGLLHVMFFHVGDRSYQARWNYDAALNVVYVLQLATVCAGSLSGAASERR